MKQEIQQTEISEKMDKMANDFADTLPYNDETIRKIVVVSFKRGFQFGMAQVLEKYMTDDEKSKFNI